MELTIRNKNNKSITFTTVYPLAVTDFKDEGISVNLISSKGTLEDGESYINNRLERRPLSLSFAIMSETKEQLIEYTQNLYEVISPKLGECQLIYNNRVIPVLVEAIPAAEENNINLFEGTLRFTASNPFWQDVEKNKVDIAEWIGDFHFALTIPTMGITMGHRVPNLIVNVENKGDVETGLIVEFIAKGTVVNPSIFNVNTREYLKIKKTMVAGEVITVNTNFNEKEITSNINGVESDAMNDIDIDSTWLQLNSGDNLFRYDAEQNVDNLSISAYYVNKYFGRE